MRKRILEISKKQNLSHIGSNLGMADVLKKIYPLKKGELLILDAGHSHLAHLVAREKYEGKPIGKIHDIHCNKKDGCDAETGSLGIGICIALGRAFARKENVYCVLSDGGCEEGSVWEALRIKTQFKIKNLKVYVNANGWNALGRVNISWLERRLKAFADVKVVRTNSSFSGGKGVSAHYQKL